MNHLTDHIDALAGSVLGVSTSVAMNTGAVDMPPGMPWEGQLIFALVVALAPIALKVLMGQMGQKPPDKLPPPPCDPPKTPDNEDKK